MRIDQNGIPSIFGTTDAANSFADELPGHSGTRAAVRLAAFFNTDLTLAKTFKLPKEGQRIQFRAEAFNVFNNVNFINPSLTLTSPLTFGEFQGAMPPRIVRQRFSMTTLVVNRASPLASVTKRCPALGLCQSVPAPNTRRTGTPASGLFSTSINQN